MNNTELAKEIYFSIAKELGGDDLDLTGEYERWLNSPDAPLNNEGNF